MGFELKRLVSERKLIRMRPDRKLILKEVDGARTDLEEAKDSLKKGKFKSIEADNL